LFETVVPFLSLPLKKDDMAHESIEKVSDMTASRFIGFTKFVAFYSEFCLHIVARRAVSRQRLGKHVTAATDTHATIEKHLENIFYTRSVHRGYKEDN
jgi:hypothetical protein